MKSYVLPSDEGETHFFSEVLPEGQGQNLALTVVYVPSSLDRGVRAVLIDTVLNVSTTMLQKSAAVPKRSLFVSLNSGLESNNTEEEEEEEEDSVVWKC